MSRLLVVTAAAILSLPCAASAQKAAGPQAPAVGRPQAPSLASATPKLAEARKALDGLRGHLAEAVKIDASWKGRMDRSLGIRSDAKAGGGAPGLPSNDDKGFKPIFGPPGREALARDIRAEADGLFGAVGALKQAADKDGPGLEPELGQLDAALGELAAAAGPKQAHAAADRAHAALAALERKLAARK